MNKTIYEQTKAYHGFEDPIAVEEIKSDAGIRAAYNEELL